MQSRPDSKFKYIPKCDRTKSNSTNMAEKYASRLLKSNISLVSKSLALDYDKILKGGCVYIPNLICDTDDFTLFNKLKSEITECSVQWSKHSKYENPTNLPTFNEIISRIKTHFNMDIIETRLNYYKDRHDWKPLHHDRHAYITENNNTIREDYTVGVSLGFTRCLQIVHEESNQKFEFPQHNGDVFAFDADINKKFLHGVPKCNNATKTNPIGCSEERFSIIAWGKKNDKIH